MKRNSILSNFMRLVVAIGVLAGLTAAQTPSSFVVLNEIQVNNPGGDSQECEYMELRGDAGTFIPSNTYLVEMEGDGTGAGNADFVSDLSTQFFGSNGILVVRGAGLALNDKNFGKNAGNLGGGIPCGTRSYTASGGTDILDPSVSLENGTISFLLINSPTTAITQGTDYDTDNNGTLEALPMDATIIDAVGWTDSPPVFGLGINPDFVYGGVNVTPANAIPPDGATRDFNNIMPLTNAAWFADDIAGPSIDSVLYDQTNLIGGYRIDFITPGAQNLAPTAAPGNISGRISDSNGRGLRFITIMLIGDGLPEPLYATTNAYGRYSFEDIPLGETYVLQVFSKRYVFKQSSIVVNLDDSITDADFIGRENK